MYSEEGTGREFLKETLRQPTFGHLLAVFHRSEVDGGDGTDHLHGFSFYQAGVLLVPTSPLQVQTSDKYSILEEGEVQSANDEQSNMERKRGSEVKVGQET